MAESAVTSIDGIRDLVVEATNARDLELLSLAEGVDLPQEIGDRLQFMIERRPRVALTRGDIDGLPVAAVWVPDTHDAYVPAGHLEFVIDGNSIHLTAVNGRDERLVAESPPGFQVAEWESSSDTGWWE